MGSADVEEIDALNIYWASRLAMRRAVEGLSVTPQQVLVDGRRLKDLDIPQQPLIKGDAKSLTIAAASITRAFLARPWQVPAPELVGHGPHSLTVDPSIKAFRATGARAERSSPDGPYGA